MKFLAFIILLLASSAAVAGTYSVNVTRKSQNLYKVTGKDIFIATQYCYEYVYSEDSVLQFSYGSGKIIFPDEGSSCDVKAIYGVANVTAGTYDITVNQDEDDWYESSDVGVYIHTDGCLSLALGEEAVLKIGPGGYGKIIFVNESVSCTVDGVYTKLRL